MLFFFFLVNHKSLLPIIECGALVSRKVVVSACCFRVDGSLPFFNLFLCSTRESNELFLDAASVISSPEFIEVSVAGTGWRSACACAAGVGEMFKAFVRASYWLY